MITISGYGKTVHMRISELQLVLSTLLFITFHLHFTKNSKFVIRTKENKTIKMNYVKQRYDQFL